MAGQRLRFIRVQHDELDPGPLPRSFQDSTMGPFTHCKLPWLRLTANDGTVGQGNLGTLGPPGGVLQEPIRRVLLKDGPHTPQEWWQKIFWMLRNAGHRNPTTAGVLYGLDMAMRDILAQRCGQAWHRFVGATRDQVPVYGSGGGTNLSLDDLVAEMSDLVASGFRIVKMKVGKDFGTCMEEDVERVKAVREAIGNEPDIAVDANQVWSAEQALDFASRIADLGIVWFEEPVHSADRHALRELCKSCPIPVAMGESENHWLGFRDLFECGVHHLQPSPHCLPGYDRWCEAVALAEQRGGLWTAHGFPHLQAIYVATRPGGMVEYLRPIFGHLATCWTTKPVIENGLIRLPTTPGLPVVVDWKGLKARGAVRSIVDDKA